LLATNFNLLASNSKFGEFEKKRARKIVKNGHQDQKTALKYLSQNKNIQQLITKKRGSCFYTVSKIMSRERTSYVIKIFFLTPYP